MYYVYILQSSKKRLYIGYSSNLKKRIAAHSNHRVKSTQNDKYALVYYEAYINKADAVGRELFLKSGSGRKYINKQLHHFFTENGA